MNRETEYTQGGKSVCSSNSDHVMSFFTEAAHTTQCEQAAQVKRPVPNECVGDCMVSKKGEQDEGIWRYVSCSHLKTRLITEFKSRGSSLRSETRTLIKSMPEATRQFL